MLSRLKRQAEKKFGRSVTFQESEHDWKKEDKGSKNIIPTPGEGKGEQRPPQQHNTWPSTSASGGGKRRSSGMEVGVASYTPGRPVGASPDRGRGPPRGNLHVEFAPIGEVKERKEKYLTAKYGAHQMSLIRKRLNVEMWMFDQLQSLYPSPEGKHEEKELDLDELLDVEGELKRKKYLWDALADCKQSKDKVETFINELLERATTL